MSSSRRKILIDTCSSGGADNAYRPLISGDGARAYYRHGYYHAAMDSISGLLSGRGALKSAMPLLSLGRHYIELAIKDLLSKVNAFDVEQSDKKFGHNLKALVEEAERVLDQYDKEYVARLDEVKPFVLEMYDADRRADAFRYATDRKDTPQFQDSSTVDVIALRDALTDAYELFEGTLRDMDREEHAMDEAIKDAVDRDPY